MFKRQIQIGLVKGSRKNADAPDETVSTDEVLESIKTVVVGTGFVALELMAAYVTLDTIRKIAVNRLSK